MLPLAMQFAPVVVPSDKGTHNSVVDSRLCKGSTTVVLYNIILIMFPKEAHVRSWTVVECACVEGFMKLDLVCCALEHCMPVCVRATMIGR